MDLDSIKYGSETLANVKRTYNRRGPMIQEQVLPLQTVA
jgi:hypothetical protein